MSKAYEENTAPLNSWLNENGFDRRGVFGTCRHKKGIPLVPNVLVRPHVNDYPSYSVTIFVGLTRVALYRCKETTPPQTNDNHTENWELVESIPYSDQEGLRGALNKYYRAEIPDMWR